MSGSEVPIAPFDHFAQEFRCCCGSVHVKQGTQIIGVMQFILAIFSCIALLFATELDPLWGFLEVASLLIEVAVLILLFLGLKKEDHRYLLPYLVYEGLWILISITVIILSFFAFMEPQSKIGHLIRGQLVEISGFGKKDEETDNSLIRLSALFTILSFIIGSIVSIWWLSVIYKCYNYFKQISKARDNKDMSMKESIMARSEIPDPPSDYASSDVKFCWGSVHVKAATQMIGIFGVVLSTFFLSGLLFTTKLNLFWGISGICFFLFNVFVFTFLFIGLKREINGFLLPYLIYQIFWILLSALWIIMYSYMFLKSENNFKPFILNQLSEISILNENNANDLLVRFYILFMINCAIIELVISVLFFYIVHKCYKYFTQLAEIQKNENMAMKYSSWDDI